MMTNISQHHRGSELFPFPYPSSFQSMVNASRMSHAIQMCCYLLPIVFGWNGPEEACYPDVLLPSPYLLWLKCPG